MVKRIVVRRRTIKATKTKPWDKLRDPRKASGIYKTARDLVQEAIFMASDALQELARIDRSQDGKLVKVMLLLKDVEDYCRESEIESGRDNRA